MKFHNLLHFIQRGDGDKKHHLHPGASLGILIYRFRYLIQVPPKSNIVSIKEISKFYGFRGTHGTRPNEAPAIYPRMTVFIPQQG